MHNALLLFYTVGNSASMVTVDSNEVDTDSHLNGEMDETHENGGKTDSNSSTEETDNDATDMDGHNTNGNVTNSNDLNIEENVH